MAKIILDLELADIVYMVVANKNESFIDDEDDYAGFVEDLAELLAKHFGGHVTERSADYMEEYDCLAVTVNHDRYVPDDGGVWRYFDRDVVWTAEGEEQR